MDKDKSHSSVEIVDVWISYHLWSATRARRDYRLEAEEQRREDAEADRHGFWAWEAVNEMVRERPEEAWSVITRLVELSPDDRILGNVAAGPLEDLLRLQPTSLSIASRRKPEAIRNSAGAFPVFGAGRRFLTTC